MLSLAVGAGVWLGGCAQPFLQPSVTNQGTLQQASLAVALRVVCSLCSVCVPDQVVWLKPLCRCEDQ